MSRSKYIGPKRRSRSRSLIHTSRPDALRVLREVEALRSMEGVRTRQASVRPEAVVALQRLAGNRATSQLLTRVSDAELTVSRLPTHDSNWLTIQRLAAKDALWDSYHTAYWSRMKSRYIDRHWLNLFFHFEKRLHEAQEAARGGRGAAAYDDDAVQDAYDQLAELGFEAPAPAPDPVLQAARNLLTAANARWADFRGNRALNRGAWAGSHAYGGRPADYVRTAANVIAALRNMQLAGGGRLGSWWLMASDAAPSGNALHRGGVDVRGDFIYHL